MGMPDIDEEDEEGADEGGDADGQQEHEIREVPMAMRQHYVDTYFTN
jgi:hypothetical protein